MITIHDSERTITIPDREELIKAIARAMIWKAHDRSDREGDDTSMITLARLIEQLVMVEE
jgi:hypothetical protein